VYDGVDRTLDVSQGGSHVLDVSIPVPALQVTFHDPGGVYADVQRTLDVSQGRSHVLDVSIPAPALQLTFHDPDGCWEQTGVGVDLEPGPQVVDAAMGRRGVGFLTVDALIDRARRRISQLAKRADDPDLPGFDREEIDVRLREDTLELSASRETAEETGASDFVRCERRRSDVSRSIRLPEPVDAEGTTATHENGVLTVTLPKRTPDESAGTDIPVN